jgi:hypothetical protein
MTDIQSAPLSNIDQLAEKLLELQRRLQQQQPNYEQLLQIIHRELQKDENMVHLLSDEQVGTIVAGLSKKKGIVIAEMAKTASGKVKENKRLAAVTVEDL